jgi:beta-mannosidase
VKGGEWLQTEGYKVLYEEARRQKPRSSMALNWCYNEPWPTAANNSIINWPAEPKPAYHGVAAACRTVMASARIPRFSWSPGEAFEAELWLLNDSPEALPPGRVIAEILWGPRIIEVAIWDHAAVAINRHLSGPKVSVPLPKDTSVTSFALRLRVPGATGRDSLYPMPLARAPAST